ncbi:MAG TPA: flagellar biosynthesis protein FlgA [Candidatus Enterocloster excrementigallinarum]|uniref:Flagellar biosynthesis protein FlgA n=1 Tax=Candidatus Enterocloster excrementigallinarum TaxID=2838558 RepID=A0A9D2PVF8_9FIRM|nr:flagellar biosynthesis protein FlgA [Candidatus Enterocloster excrementigallinarum]
MIYHNLYELHKDQTASVGIIGAGHFGCAVIAQTVKQKQLRVAAVADLNPKAIERMILNAGIQKDQVAVCSTLEEAKAACASGKMAAVTDPMILMDLPIDVIVEGTGNPEAGAKHAVGAIKSHKHIVMVNKETDSCVGPILRKMAEEEGVIYSPIDGDQHGALMQMVEWARDLGLEVICAGKSRDAEFIFDRKEKTVTVYCDEITIPKTVTAKLSQEEAELMETMDHERMEEVLSGRKKVLHELDPRGGFDLCEMVIAANSTGLKPDTELLYDHILRIAEIPSVLCEKKDGGILNQHGVIEVVTNLHEKGEAGLGGGVFLVVKSLNPYSQMILATKGCVSNEKGTVSLIYRPYHLCGVEAASTLMCVGILGVATGSGIYEQKFDIVQEAQIDLKAGERMGSDHDSRLLTHMVPASPIKDRGPVPAHLLNGRKLLVDVPKGTVITYDMVEEPSDSVLWQLRREQDKLFHN